MSLKPYIQLVKPGIIMGNLVSGLGGYFYATNGAVVPHILVGSMLGLILIIGSACSFNNIIDMDIDGLMSRTKKRPLITGEISKRTAFIFSTILALLGFSCLLFLSTMTAFLLGVFAFFVYVVAYSLWTKRQSVYGTFVGSFSGAVPVVVGYVAVTNEIDLQAVMLFTIYVIWQMPHSYGIAFFRFDDYKKANISVLPVVKGFDATRLSIMVHISVFTILLALFGYLGFMHPVGVLFSLSISLYWLYTAVFMFHTMESVSWGKQIFFQSIFIVIVMNLCLGFNGLLMGV